MTLPPYKDIDSFVDIAEIDTEILNGQKTLLKLRFAMATKKKVLPHYYVHVKRRLAHLNFKRSLIFKSKS